MQRTIKARGTHARPGALLDYLLVALLAFVVFLPWIQGYFLGDDWMLLARNSGRALPEQLRLISDTSNSRWYRPLSELSLAWSWSWFGLNPVGHHILNFALHALNGVLVAIVGRRLAQDRRVGLLAGLSFAVLSCHTEAVVWITARHEMLATMFALLSLISYIRFRDSGRRAWWGGAFLFYIVSLGFKETTLALPLFLTLYDLIFVFPLPKRNQSWRQLWRPKASQLIPLAPPVTVGIAYLLFRLQTGGGYDVPFNVLASLKNFIYYLLMETVALPVSTHFLSRFPLWTWPVIVSLTVACVLSVWLARDRIMRDRVAWFGGLWMVFALAPVILIVTERTTHFSSVGWAWTIAATVVLAWDAAAPGRSSPKRWLVILVVVVILGANLVTLTHRGYWWDRAAHVSRDLFARVQVSLQSPPPGKDNQLWFVNLPNRIEYAYPTFGNRVLFAVWLLQGQVGTDAQALVFQDEVGEVNVSPSERVKQLLSERAVEGPVVVFYWQAGALQVESSIPESALPPD